MSERITCRLTTVDQVCGVLFVIGLALFLLGVLNQPSGLPQASRVIDGDTLIVRGERIRLWGIDAPERRQACRDFRHEIYSCGALARDYLSNLIAGDFEGLTCSAVDHDRHGRTVARCLDRDGRDLGALMVRAGWAVDYTHHSGGYYLGAQAAAARSHAGMWVGTFERPADYRRERRGR